MKDWGCSITEMEHIIDEWIFSERDRAIMKRIILDDITYESAAAEFGLSPRGVAYIVKRNTNILQQHM